MALQSALFEIRPSRSTKKKAKMMEDGYEDEKDFDKRGCI